MMALGLLNTMEPDFWLYVNYWSSGGGGRGVATNSPLMSYSINQSIYLMTWKSQFNRLASCRCLPQSIGLATSHSLNTSLPISSPSRRPIVISVLQFARYTVEVNAALSLRAYDITGRYQTAIPATGLLMDTSRQSCSIWWSELFTVTYHGNFQYDSARYRCIW